MTPSLDRFPQPFLNVDLRSALVEFFTSVLNRAARALIYSVSNIYASFESGQAKQISSRSQAIEKSVQSHAENPTLLKALVNHHRARFSHAAIVLFSLHGFVTDGCSRAKSSWRMQFPGASARNANASEL